MHPSLLPSLSIQAIASFFSVSISLYVSIARCSLHLHTDDFVTRVVAKRRPAHVGLRMTNYGHVVNADVLRRYNSIVGATVLEDTLAAGVVWQPRILFPTLTQPCPHSQGKLFAYPRFSF